MTTHLSDGENLSNLINNGSEVAVTYANLEDYISRTIKARLGESKRQIKAIKRGMSMTFSASLLKYMSSTDLERKVVGSEEVDVDRLKEITSYKNCSDSHEVIKRFWKVFSAFDNDTRIMYLRFVWGRTRLPLAEDENIESHTL